MDNRIEKSFGKLKSLVLNDAHMRREELSKEIEEKTKQKLAEKKAELEKNAERKLSSDISKIEKESRERLIKQELEFKQELMGMRKKMTDAVFSEVSDKLREYMNTTDYVAWLEKKTEEALCECGDGEKILLLNNKDINKIDFGIKKQQCDIFGGVRVLNSEKGIIVDYSLDTLIEEKRHKFLKNSGLMIEI